jgi:glutathione synthase
MPRTLVSADKTKLRAFVEQVGGRAVLKPLDGAGGEGVMALTIGDMNFNAIIEATTRNGRRLAMAQEFLPAVRQGDKRILLLDGQPLGAIMRVPRSDDMRSNIHVGGSVVQAALDEADQKIIATLAPRLRQDGLYFVGLDVIGGKLTEVNVTSPTGIQQMTRLDGQNYAGRVIEWIASRVK